MRVRVPPSALDFREFNDILQLMVEHGTRMSDEDLSLYQKGFSLNEDVHQMTLLLGVRTGRSPSYPLIVLEEQDVASGKYSLRTSEFAIGFQGVANSRPSSVEEITTLVQVARKFAPRSGLTTILITVAKTELERLLGNLDSQRQSVVEAWDIVDR